MIISKNPYLAPSISSFAALAVVCAGAGGLVSAEPLSTVFVAGSGFWLLMLLVPRIFMPASVGSHLTQSALAAAYGAIVGLCFGLCFVTGEGWSGVLSIAAGGGAIGFAGYWAWFVRAGGFWREV